MESRLSGWNFSYCCSFVEFMVTRYWCQFGNYAHLIYWIRNRNSLGTECDEWLVGIGIGDYNRGSINRYASDRWWSWWRYDWEREVALAIDVARWNMTAMNKVNKDVRKRLWFSSCIQNYCRNGRRTRGNVAIDLSPVTWDFADTQMSTRMDGESPNQFQSIRVACKDGPTRYNGFRWNPLQSQGEVTLIYRINPIPY